MFSFYFNLIKLLESFSIQWENRQVKEIEIEIKQNIIERRMTDLNGLEMLVV